MRQGLPDSKKPETACGTVPDCPSRQQHRQVAVLLVLFGLVAGYFSIRVPAFETPDEFQHYAVVQHIVTWYDLPKSEPDTPGLWRQQGVQAPLYYMMGAWLTFWIDQSEFPLTAHRVNRFARLGQTYATDNRNFFLPHTDDGWVWRQEFLALHILRFFSVCLSCLALYAVYRFLRLLMPHDLALVSTAVCAFIPQFVFISGAVSNDSLITAVASLLLWRLAAWLREVQSESTGFTTCFHRRPWELGGLLAMALLAKLSSLGLVAVTGLVVAWVAWQRSSWRILWTVGWRLAISAFLLAGWWFGRNIWLYGDPLAWNIWESNITLRGAPLQIGDLQRELPGMFQSFWGQFGWLTVPYPDGIYGIFATFALFLAAGIAIWLWRTARSLDPDMYLLENPRVFQALVTTTWFLILGGSWFRFMLVAPAAQGRYLFPAMSALALGVSLCLALIARPYRQWTWCLPISLACLCLATPAWIINPAYMPPSFIQHADLEVAPIEATVGHDLTKPYFLLEGIKIDQTFEPGAQYPVYVRLTTLNPVMEDYAIFLHLRDEAGQVLAQYDGVPGGGLWPTSQWPVMETRTERFTLTIPRQVAVDSQGTIVFGFYNPWTWMRPLWCNLPSQSDCRDTENLPNEYEVGSFRIIAKADSGTLLDSISHHPF